MEKWPNFKKKALDTAKKALFVAGITASTIGGVKAQEALPDNTTEKTQEKNISRFRAVVEAPGEKTLDVSFDAPSKSIGDYVLMTRYKDGSWIYANDQDHATGFHGRVFRVPKKFDYQNSYTYGMADSVGESDLEYKNFKIIELENLSEIKNKQNTKQEENSKNIFKEQNTKEEKKDSVFDELDSLEEEIIKPEIKNEKLFDSMRVQIIRKGKEAEIVNIPFVEGVSVGDEIYINHERDIIDSVDKYEKSSVDEENTLNFRKNSWGAALERRKAKVLGFIKNPTEDKKDKKEEEKEEIKPFKEVDEFGMRN